MTNTFAPPVAQLLALPKLGLPPRTKIAVIGAGAFGGWSALYLLRKGFDVTLIDAWGPGNSRSTSGDETRVTRSTYGANEFYFSLNVRALELWKENQVRWGKQLFYPNGVIWFCYTEENPWVDASIPFAEKYNVPYTYLTPAEIHKQFPTVNTSDLHGAWLDPHGGYLKARESCLAVHASFVKEGGRYQGAYATPGDIDSGRMTNLALSSGEHLQADIFLFACGPWLGQLFPEVLGQRITCTKQEVFYFGVPPGMTKTFDSLPAWIDLDGHNYYYGIPGNENRGFKIGVDIRGDVIDPTHSERIANGETLAKAREFLGHRFPALRSAPLLENRVCCYENSPDGNFIFEPHPEAANVWLLGGGSGHGFKHGPALGEWVANAFA